MFKQCFSSLKKKNYECRYFRHASGSLFILSNNLARYININRCTPNANCCSLTHLQKLTLIQHVIPSLSCFCNLVLVTILNSTRSLDYLGWHKNVDFSVASFFSLLVGWWAFFLEIKIWIPISFFHTVHL